jgi:PAS domain S-box-containing protein
MNRRPSLLIVDDYPPNIEFLCSVLEGNWTLFIATDGAKCLEIARQHQPDLILLDIMMPEMDGFETCLRLKADPATSEIPVIFATSAGEEESELEGLAVGAVDFVRRPIRVPILKARLNTQIERRRAEKRLLASEKKHRLLFYSSPVAAILTARDFSILELNPAFAELTEYSADELRQRSLLELLHEPDKVAFNQFIGQVLNGDTEQKSIDLRIENRLGEPIWANLLSSCIDDSTDEQFSCVLSIVQDIRERVAHVESLTHAIGTNREISMAVGLLMERLDIPAAEAFERLRDLSRRMRVRLVEAARAVTGEESNDA